MNAKRLGWEWKKGLWAIVCALAPIAGVVNAAPAGGTEVPIGLESVCQRLDLSPECRQRFEDLLRGREALLEYLPLAQLAKVTLESGRAELRFDFGKKESKRIKIPAAKLWALDKKGRVVQVETEAREVLIHDRVRIEIDPQGNLRLKKGDLEYETTFRNLDLEAYTLRQPNRLVRDKEDRVILRLDGEGQPFLQDGRPVVRTCDEWLVIEGALGNRFEIPLSLP